MGFSRFVTSTMHNRKNSPTGFILAMLFSNSNFAFRGFPPLHRAAALGEVVLVETLLADFDLHQTFRRKRPLEWACRCGQIEVARLLLQNGADARINYDSEDWAEGAFGPFQGAVLADSVPLVELLLAHGAVVGEETVYGATPLHCARSAKMARFLIPLFKANANAGIETETIEGLTPLHCAAAKGRRAVLKCLIEAGANPHHNWCETGRPPIHRAALKRHLGACRLLLEHGVNINAPDTDGRTALDETLSHATDFWTVHPHISLAVFVAWMLERGAHATQFSFHEIAEIVHSSVHKTSKTS